jgi:mycothiol maleylpyruvate isomerase-like protein
MVFAKSRTNTAGTHTLADARAALQEVVPSLIALVRNISDPNAASVGTWGVADVAAHLSHVFRLDADAIAGRPIPSTIVNTAGVAELNARMLAEDEERDPAVLADRIDVLAKEFDDVASRATADTVSWLQGARMSPSAVACHLLEECLVHGHDIARATGLSWSIHSRHALLVVEGGVLPLIAALPPTAFVNQERSGSFRACVELCLRGGGRTLLVLDDGSLTLGSDARRPVDAHISTDPAALMLTFLGRQGIAKPLLMGKLAVWGRRPWKLARALGAMSPP